MPRHKTVRTTAEQTSTPTSRELMHCWLLPAPSFSGPCRFVQPPLTCVPCVSHFVSFISQSLVRVSYQDCLAELRLFSHSVRLIAILQRIVHYVDQGDDALSHALSESAGRVLTQAWEGKPDYSAKTLGVVVRAYIVHSPDTLLTLQKLSSNVLTSVGCGEEDSEHNIFRYTLNKKTLRFYFVPVIEELVTSLKRVKIAEYQVCVCHARICFRFARS